MHRWLLCLLILSACTTEGLSRGTAAACAPCTSDLDCTQGLLCAKTYGPNGQADVPGCID